MSGPVLDFDPASRARDDAPQADSRPKPGFFDLLGAGAREAVDKISQVQDAREADAYRPLIEALVERGHRRSGLHHGAPGFFGIGPDQLGAPDYAKIWREAKRAGIEGLPETQAQFEQQAKGRAGGRARDQDTLARAEGIVGTGAGMIGGMAGSMVDPVNAYSVFLPGAGAAASLARKVLVDGATNAAVEAFQTTDAKKRYAALGEEYSLGQAASDIGMAGGGGALLRGGIEGGKAGATALRDTIDAKFPDRALARELRRMVPEHLRTPEQEAALFVAERQADIDEASPFVRTYDGIDAHRARLDAAKEAIEEGRVVRPSELIEPARPVERLNEGGSVEHGFRLAGDRASVAGELAKAGWSREVQAGFLGNFEVEGGYGGALGDGGSASGIAQWRHDRRANFRVLFGKEPHLASKAEQARFVVWEMRNPGKAGMTVAQRDAILAAKSPEEAAALIDRHYERSSGAHRGRRQAEARAIFGGEARQGDADLADSGAEPFDEPPVRPEALDAVRPTVVLAGRAIPITQVEARDVGVDAELMQFKSGGDAEGVTARLRGVEQWDSYAAGMVTVWEARDGRRLIADGHQRLGLARKLEGEGHPPIQLNAYVLREADGVTAEKARVVTALKNIGEGTGTALDAAKVFRAVGLDSDEVARRLPRTDPLIRDGKALTRLSDEAFGAVVNDVVAEKYGAAIGHLVEDRALHAGMVKVIFETGPASRAEGEAIIRQALDAGFVREVQDSLFGSDLAQVGLFARRARLLGQALRELRKLKGAFAVAARNADALDAAGNRIDVAASEAAGDANARALALVDALALRKGNAVNDLLNEAARRIGAGEPQARVLRDFVAGLRALDLEDVARGAGRADRAGDGAVAGGRAGEPAEPGGFVRDGLESEQLSPAALDAQAAARPWSDHSDPELFADPDPKWQEPDGDGAERAADSLWHDLEQMEASEAAGTAQARLDRAREVAADLSLENVAIDGVGPLGPQIAGLEGRWPEAVRLLRALGDGDAQGVLMHPQAGLIDVVWGDERGGLAHILDKHAGELGDDFQDVMYRMQVVGRERDRLLLRSEGTEAVVALDWQGERKRWLLTAYARPGSGRSAAEPLADRAAQSPGRSELDDIAQARLPDNLGDEGAAATIDIGDGRGELPVAAVRAELDGDRAALEAMKQCLK